MNAVDAGGEASSQIWTVTYPGGAVSRVTNDLSTYSGVGLSADGSSFVSVRNETRTRVWAIQDNDLARAHEITAGAGTDDGVMGLAWTPDKRLSVRVFSDGQHRYLDHEHRRLEPCAAHQQHGRR